MPIDPSPLSAAPRDRLDDGLESSRLLGSPPSLPVGAAAMRARQAIKASLFPEQTALAPQIGRFVVLRELGRGGMGVVYIAYDETLDRRVALKLLYDLPGDADGQARLLREAQTMARLNHPNIAAVFEAGTHEGRVYVAMEFVQGQPLDVWLSEKQRPWREVVDVFVQAGRGLHAAHCAGLVHRDFKPANVMLGQDGRVRVLDFGLARGTRALTPDTTLGPLATMSVTLPIMPLGGPLTREGTIVGTPAYMPPEQFCGQPIDPRADQYALCVSMYEGLYGRLPFHGESLTELWAAVLDGPPKAPPRGPRVPGWLHRLVLRGLDPDQARRFTSVATLISAIERPRRRMRDWLSGVLTFGIIIGFLGYDRWLDVQCDMGEEDLVGIWDAERKAEFRKLYETSGIQLQEDWESAEKSVGNEVSGWLKLKHDTCRAYRDGTESKALYEKRSYCLSRFPLALGATLGAMRHQRNLSSWYEHVNTLRHLPACNEKNASEWPVDLPPAHQHDEVSLLHTELASIENKQLNGTSPEVLEASRRLVATAHTLGYAPLWAETLRQRSKLERAMGLGADSCESLKESIFIAESIDYSLLTTESVKDELRFCRDSLRSSSFSLTHWAENFLNDTPYNQLDKGLARAWQRTERERIQILMELSSKLVESGNLAAATDALSHALQAASTTDPFAVESGQTLSLIKLARRYLNKSNNEQNNQHIRKLIAAATNTLNKTDNEQLTIYKFWQNTQDLIEQGKWREAAEYARSGVIFVRAFTSSDPRAIAHKHDEYAFITLLSDRCRDALHAANSARQAGAKAKEVSKDLQISMLQNGVISQAWCGDLRISKTLLKNFRQMDLGDSPRAALSLHAAEAVHALQDGDASRAVDISKIILDHYKDEPAPSEAVSYILHMRIHIEASHDAGLTEAARSAAKRMIAFIEQSWGPDHIALAMPLTIIGQIELGSDEIDEAVSHLDHALALREDSDPMFRGDAAFALARALAKKAGGEKRARLLGEQALAEYAAAGPRRARERGEVGAWLAAL